MTFIEAATQKLVVKRAAKLAMVVGTILVGINYGDRIIAWNLTTVDWVKMAMTYCVPYCVSTYSAVTTIMDKQT